MLPPLAVQVTPLLVIPTPETDTVNLSTSLGFNTAVLGVTLTLDTTALTVTCVLLIFVGSATLVAVTVKIPAVVAVNRPLPLMLPPPLTDHVTPVFTAPLTVEVNCKVLPAFTDPLAGEGVLIPIALTFTVAEPALLPSWVLVAVTV